MAVRRFCFRHPRLSSSLSTSQPELGGPHALCHVSARSRSCSGRRARLPLPGGARRPLGGGIRPPAASRRSTSGAAGVSVPRQGEDARQRPAASTSSPTTRRGSSPTTRSCARAAATRSSPGKSGFAHFFEHMMFRGTERYPQDKYNDVIKAMGADSNAFTSDDLTVYHILAGKAALPKIVEIEADRFQHLQVPRARLPEGGAGRPGRVQQERLQPDREDGRGAATTTPSRAHTYKHTTMGFLKDIENMPNEFAYSRQFFDRYYRPDNVVLLVVGDVDARDGRSRWSRSTTASWKRGRQAPGRARRAAAEARRSAPPSRGRAATLPMLLEGYHAPAFSTTNVDVPTLDVLAELLFAERAPLYKRLVIKEQKVETLSGFDRRARRSRTCSRCSRASRSRTTSPTSRRRSTTRWPASRARASTTRRWPRSCRT